MHVEGALADRTNRSVSLSLELVSVALLMNSTHNSPSTDDDQFTTLIKNNPQYTTRKLPETLNISKSAKKKKS